jgi:hypothetical protein
MIYFRLVSTSVAAKRHTRVSAPVEIGAVIARLPI